jgi:hypothetical protein
VPARERQLGAAAQADAVDRGDRRHVSRFDAQVDLLPLTNERLGLRLVLERGDRLDVRARDEAVRLAARDHEHAQLPRGRETARPPRSAPRAGA